MTENEITEISELLIPGNKIVIISHANPDGDAVGSVLAFYSYLLKNNMAASAIMPDKIPAFYNWLENSEQIYIAEQEPQKCKALIMEANAVFCLDFNAFNRVGDLEKDLEKARGIKILIDHHPSPAQYFDYIISDTSVSSTAELVFQFFGALGGNNMVDKTIAEAVYVGIMTDTGSFNYNSHNPQMYEVLKQLVTLGVDPAVMHQRVFDAFSESRMRLIGHSLLNKMELIPETHSAYIILTKDDLSAFNYEKGDTEGLVNYPLSVKGIIFAALFIEKDDLVKISFRSKGTFAANLVARDYFNGGGHINAAGGKSYMSLNETVELFESLMKNEFNENLLKATNEYENY